MIYVDNAATTKLDSEALEAMMPFLTDFYGNPSSRYQLGREASKEVSHAREKIASFIGAKENEIFFTSGGSEADSWVINTFVGMQNKKQIITTAIEHHAIINACEAAKCKGGSVKYLQVDNTGIVDVDELIDGLKEETALVSIAYANNEIGTIQDIKLLADKSHEKGAYFHSDAVQAIGHESIDVNALNADMLSASANKFNGPKGIGFLYKRNGLDIFPIIFGGKQEYAIRGGTENVASIIGMATALENNIKNLDANRHHIKELEHFVRGKIRNQISDVIFNGNNDRHLPRNVSISFRGIDAEALINLLDLKGVCVSAGSACNEGTDEASHVLKSIRVPSDYIMGTISVSLGKYNTLEEMERFCEILFNNVNVLRRL